MFKFARIGVLLLGLVHMSASWSADETFTLNLKDADIDALIATVAKKTGKNFVMDPRVKAKVTVISNKEMSADELYSVFLSVLQVHGYAAVPSGNIIKILPDVNAKQGPVPTINSGRGISADELVTRVIPIKNVAASQLVPILRPLVPQQGHLAAYAGSNIIVVTDRSSNISRLVDIIYRIDRPDNDEIEFIRMEHASAAEVVRILNSLQQKTAGKGADIDAPQLAADDRTNSILISGSKAARARIRALVASLDSPLEEGGNTKVIYLKYAKAADLADILKGVNEGQKKAAQASSGGKAASAAPSAADKEIDIQADEETNALIITAAPAALKNIESVIRQLDIRRAQVHVEAIIAEVSSSGSLEYGFSYLTGNTEIDSDNSSTSKPVGGIVLGGAGDDINRALAATQGLAAPAVPNGFTVAFGEKDSNGDVFAGILKAIAADGSSNILSTPSLVTLDNQEAEIVVGQEVPIQKGGFTETGGNAGQAFQTFEREDVGIKLKIKPQINEGDTIQLELEQEVSDAFTDPVSLQIIKNKRNIKTNVMVEDGQLLILGGLIDDNGNKSISKVPLLGDIPLIGRLFQYRSSSKRKRNLMVFIHPTIIKDRAVSDLKTQAKYNYMLAEQMKYGLEPGLLQVDLSGLPKIEVSLKKETKASAKQSVPTEAANDEVVAPAEESTPVNSKEEAGDAG